MIQKDILNNLTVGTWRSCKKQLKKNFQKHEDSTEMQLSATKILTFLINDMLDYAQLSAGQFRKFSKEFDFIKSVDDVAKIMRLKADELKIIIDINLSSLVNHEKKHISAIQPEQPGKFLMCFDEQRL